MHFELRNTGIQELAKIAGVKVNEYAAILIGVMYDHDAMIDDEPDFYGATINEIFEDYEHDDLKSYLRESGIKEEDTDKALTYLLRCEIIGEGDCPCCGSETESSTIYDWDNWTIQCDEHTCPHCGYKYYD